MKITPRVAVTLTFLAFGMMLGGQIGAFPALREQTGINAFEFGALSMLAAVANIGAMSLGGVINRYFDHRSMLLFILPLTFAFLAVSLTPTSLWFFAITWTLLNAAAGTMDLFMNAEASIVEHELGKPVFSSFHSAVLYAIGGAGFLSGYISNHFGPIWSTVPAIPFVAAAIYAVHKAIPHRKEQQQEKSAPAVSLPVKILVLIGIILGLDVAAELACIQWSGQLLGEMRPDLIAYSGLGVGFYGLCSGTLRLIGDRLRLRFGDIPLVMISLAIGLVGFIVLSLRPSFAISVLAYAVTGCGLGLVFPCMFALAGRLVPEARAAALGLTAMISGPPRILLPLLLGWLAQTQGLSTIYIAAAIGIAAAIFFTYLTARAVAQTRST
jgi:predicted MFS family arabinose efflux permease